VNEVSIQIPVWFLYIGRTFGSGCSKICQELEGCHHLKRFLIQFSHSKGLYRRFVAWIADFWLQRLKLLKPQKSDGSSPPKPERLILYILEKV
jgi:hypothetical protein